MSTPKELEKLVQTFEKYRDSRSMTPMERAKKNNDAATKQGQEIRVQKALLGQRV
jgi:hypothetical protein